MTPNIERFIEAYTYRTYDLRGRKVYAGHLQYAETVRQCLPAGFTERHAWRDGHYRAVWTSDSALAVVTYCEGDVLVTKHATRADYEREISEAQTYYEQ